MELMSRLGNQYGGLPLSFQMQTQMLSRLHQMRLCNNAASAQPSPADPSSSSSPASSKGSFPTFDYAAYPPPPYHEPDGPSSFDQDHRFPPPSHPPPPPPPPPHHHHLQHLPFGFPDPHLPPHLPPSAWGRCLPPQGVYSHDVAPSPTSSQGLPPSSYPAYPVQSDPHEATVDSVLSSLIQEMKSIMQRDLNRKMVENIAFGTFDEWWERKEVKAKEGDEEDDDLEEESEESIPSSNVIKIPTPH
ncbi:UNVERIFIED_CONTAM: hypothetical protein FKN15_021552 [Acipenser sinensis]